MMTGKPISTISFNSQPFCLGVLHQLADIGRFSAWVAIPHKGEDDDAGKKDHIHIFAEPSKRLQTDDLKGFFAERDPLSDKPRSILPWRSSSFSDWYLYCLHDRQYLTRKGLERRYHYKDTDFLSSDPDYLRFLVRNITAQDYTIIGQMQDAQKAGLSWPQFFARGSVPVQLVKQYKMSWDLLACVYNPDIPF